jgi:hypothetical protein
MAASFIESPNTGIEQARMARNTAESAIFVMMEVGKCLMVVPPQDRDYIYNVFYNDTINNRKVVGSSSVIRNRE